MEAIERSVIVERKNDSFLDLYERLKALNSPLKNEREFEPHHRSSSTKPMTNSCYINNNKKEEIDKNLQTLKATDIRVDRKTNPIEERVTRIEDKRKDFIKERSTIESVRDIINEDKERDKIRKGMVKETLESSNFERLNSEKKEVICRKLDEIDKVNNSNDSLKEMMEKHNNNKEVSSSIQIICKELEIDLQKEKEFFLKQNIKRQKDIIETKEEVGKVKDMLKPKDNSTFKESLCRKLEVEEEIGKDEPKEPKEREKVNKGRKNKNNLKEKVNSNGVVKVKVEKVEVVNKKDKKCDSLKEKIDERLKLIERSIAETQNDSLTELTKKMKILNSPLEIDRKRDNIAVLNTTELFDNEKIDRPVTNIICHKCKKDGHTKKQCDRHNKIVKQISKLEFEKDRINELMEIFNVKQKEIDQVIKKEAIKSTNPLKINKRKRKQKDIINKLIENLPDHHKDKKEY